MTQKLSYSIKAKIKCGQSAVRAVRFNVDGNYLLTCGSDKTLKLWNPYKGLLLHTYSGHGYEVLDAQGSSDNSQLCSGGVDKYVFLWDVAKGTALRRYRSHAGQVNCVRFNEESTLILSASLDGSVRAWDVKSRSYDAVQVMDEAKDSVTSLAVTDHEILTGSADGKIRRYDLRVGAMYEDTVGPTISCVNFTRDGQCVLVGTVDNALRLFDKDSTELLNEYASHVNESYKLDSCLSDTDSHIFTGSEDGAVYAYDLVEGSVAAKLECGEGRAVSTLSHHPTQPCLAAASHSQITLWRADDDKDS